MPIRYEPSSSDPRELKRERAAKDRAWQVEAEQLLKDNPDFFRLRRWHRVQFFCWALAAGGFTAWGVYWVYGGTKLLGSALAWSPAAFASVWGAGELIYSRRCRKFVLKNWSKGRESAAGKNV